LLDAQLTDPNQQRTVQRMIRAADRMTRMIEQLLDLTRARLAGGLDCSNDPQCLDVVELIRRTVEELRGTHPKHDIQLETQGDCTTTGDADRLLQLLSNLIGNALQHGTPGSAVRVRATPSERHVVVAVHNAGCIPADVLPALFDPFRTRQPSSKSGLGLGLYIAQQIAKAHAGDLRVESSEAAGTTFTVQLPRRTLDPS